MQGDQRSPVFSQINFFSDQGLGGPWELARAKASGVLASTVRPKTNKLISIFVV